MLDQEKRHDRVVNLNEVPSREQSHGRFGFKAKRIWPVAGGKQLGCSWFEVPPGKQAFPHHFHSGFEEAIFILEGKGLARNGDKQFEVGPGDYLAYPPGPDAAHSLKNAGNEPLRYLAFSTIQSLDIVVYPDSKKIAFAGGVDAAKGLAAGDVWVRGMINEQTMVGYYDGEEKDPMDRPVVNVTEL